MAETVQPPEPRSGRGPVMSQLDEGTVVSLAQDGDLAAFEHLVDLYQGRLYRLAYRMLGDRGEAEDVVQETLVAGWRVPPELERATSFGGWVYRTATNRCLDILRRRTLHPEWSIDESDTGGGGLAALDIRTGSLRGMDPHHAAEVSAELESLSRALALLPADLRACWLLREVHDQSYEQIGAALRIGPTTVRGRLARARERLAEAMIQWQ